MFEFELVPFDFSLILGNPFTVSPPPKIWSWGDFVGQVYGGIVLHGGGANDHITSRGKEFHKMDFLVI